MRWIVLVLALLVAGCDQKISAAKESVRSKLFDPDSAQFRNVRIVDGTVCGEVNGKNRYGAYVGFTPFYYVPDWSVIADDDFGRRMYLRTCVPQGR